VTASPLVRLVNQELASRADPGAAVAMAAYMKTEMPFYGVKKPGREVVLRRLVEQHPARTVGEYRSNVSTLWELDHREEKYLAIGYARRFPELIDIPQLDLFREMIVEGAWWDLVDEIAIHLIGSLLLSHPTQIAPVLEEWIDHEDIWLRRTALICQVRHREETDVAMLLDFCRRRAHEKDFFIRKAIGWALRDYSHTDPHSVRDFIESEGDRLSGLSRREASKYLEVG